MLDNWTNILRPHSVAFFLMLLRSKAQRANWNCCETPLFFSLLTRPMSVSFRWQVLLYFKAPDSWARIEPLIWLKSAINRRMQLRSRTSGVSLLRHLGKRSKKASFNGRLTRHQSQKTMAVRHKACASPPGVTKHGFFQFKSWQF